MLYFSALDSLVFRSNNIESEHDYNSIQPSGNYRTSTRYPDADASWKNRSRKELESIANEVTSNIILDLKNGYLTRTQVLQTGWIEQRVAQKLEELNSEMKTELGQNLYSTTSDHNLQGNSEQNARATVQVHFNQKHRDSGFVEEQYRTVFIPNKQTRTENNENTHESQRQYNKHPVESPTHNRGSSMSDESELQRQQSERPQSHDTRSEDQFNRRPTVLITMQHIQPEDDENSVFHQSDDRYNQTEVRLSYLLEILSRSTII